MKFVAISDTHGLHRHVKLPKGDVLLHAGDITHRGKEDEVLDFLTWFSKLNYQYKIFIGGNHDFFLEKNRRTFPKMVPDGITYLSDSGIEIYGIKIWGSPVIPWFYNWAFNVPRGQSIRKHWEKIPIDTDILITHGPPHGILDQVVTGRHIGCKDLIDIVSKIKPKFHLFGHIHESYGVAKKSSTQFINASLMNETYQLVNKPFVFELKS
jgi:Icc-related predicted phosphoesterase